MMSDIGKRCIELLEKASSKGVRVSFAESCTGGLIGASVTSFPGASSIFMGSAVTYSNEAKMDVLGVPEDILIEHGAVSTETAVAMAKGSRRIYRSDIAVSVTGIAGPGGATETKPVGLVCIGVSSGKETYARSFVFQGDRDEVRRQTVLKALELMLESI